MPTSISLFLFYIPSPPPFTVSLPSLQCQVSYFCIRGGELSMCLCVRANFYLMCYPLCVWKYTVREVSCECEWALLRSGRTYLPCYVMDPTAICIRYGGDVIWSSELHFNDGWLLAKWTYSEQTDPLHSIFLIKLFFFFLLGSWAWFILLMIILVYQKWVFFFPRFGMSWEKHTILKDAELPLHALTTLPSLIAIV